MAAKSSSARCAEPAAGGLDWFRPAAALLVVANHTSPLYDLSPAADTLLTQVLARVAVPFFLMVTGYFLLPRLERGGVWVLLPFFRRTLLLYAGATLLYLPLQLYKGCRPDGWQMLRDLLFDGTFYHLWYLPALLLGMALLCLLPRRGLPLWAALYLLGLLGDSYYGLAAALPGGRALYGLLFSCFDQTRNGLFLSPLFLFLGGRLARRPPERRPGLYRTAALAALGLLVAEGGLVGALHLARHRAMYLSLPVLLWFLFRALQTLNLPPAPLLRPAAAVVYLIHPWMIVLVRGAAKLTGLSRILVEPSLVHFLFVAAASFCTALLLCRLLPRRGPHPGARRAPPSRCWAEIDRAALRHNLAVLRGLLPPDCRIMAVVKADAYGHGALPVARVCAEAGVGAFAVATVEEGAALRRGGVPGDILVLGRSFPPEFSTARRYRLILTAADPQHGEELMAFPHPLRVHVAVDTGMGRLGFSARDLQPISRLYAAPGLRVEGMFTHLSAAESPLAEDIAFTRAQLHAFFSLAEDLSARGISPGALHVQASAGILRYRGLPCRYARPGLALYGVGSPELRPVLALKCRVALVRELSPGDAAGYGRVFRAERPTRLAVLSIGYADGLPRSLGGRGKVLLRGSPAPIVARVCMDQTFCDVTDLPEVRPGDVATLLGPGLCAREVAADAGTIPNELLSRLGNRVERRYLG